MSSKASGSPSVSMAKNPNKSPTKKNDEESSGGKQSLESSIKKSPSSTSPGKFGLLKSFLTRSPRNEVKSPQKEVKSKANKSAEKVPKSPQKEDKMAKPKKPSKSKKGEKDQNKTKQLVVGGESEKDSRSMIQTSLVNTTENIEVISSPEQPKHKVKKSSKKSRVQHSSKKQSKEEEKKQMKISDLFPSRKSSRVCKSQQEKNYLAGITAAVLSKKNEGLEVRDIEGKGRGVFATRSFSKDEFVCEYAGELISFDEAKKREEAYSSNEEIGCYMYYIQFNGNKYCIDATEESGTFGRLLNHSRTGGNCKTKLHAIKNKPHLILTTTRDIKKHEELTYDYGDRSKTAMDSHPWLKY